MNKFNQRQRNTVKERKKKARATKKRTGAAQKHKEVSLSSACNIIVAESVVQSVFKVHLTAAVVQLQVTVSGKRTGKAQKKVARQQRLQLKQAVEKGLIDLEMQDAEAGETHGAEAV